MFDGWTPQFGNLREDMRKLCVKFAGKYVGDVAKSMKDGYKTTKKVFG